LVALYIVSPQEATGKTAIGAGLGRYLQDEGKKVGYLKPDAADKGDAAFMKQVLDLAEDIEDLCPDGDVKKAYDKVAAGKDVVIVEGTAGQNSAEVADALGARVIVVEAYGATDGYKEFGNKLLGVVINKVPESQMERASAEASTRGVRVLGVLPENRTLLAVTVGELAEGLQGKILNSAEGAAELVENYMLGAMVVDSGRDYFGRKGRKAAVVRGDRPDMQLAALETPTSCLVLSSSQEPPIYNVMEKAENRGIPIISTASPTEDIVRSIEAMLSQGRFHQEKKLPRLAQLLQHLDLTAVS
jgi:BioD-like phosphotransacetylase family protein